MLRCVLIFIAGLTTLPTVAGSVAIDPLFMRMQGNWLASGQRTQLISGRKTGILAHAQTRIDGDRLYSHSEITETPEDARTTPHTYVRDYWIRAAAGDRYELGVGAKVTSVGNFTGDTLSVEQRLGGTPAYVIRSSTRFDESGSSYDEVFWSGARALAKTSIRYERVP